MSIRMLRLACAVVTLAALPVAAALAQSPRDQRTYFTFSQSVDLPGKTLPAGTYLFRLVDSPGNRHIVQVLDGDGKNVQTTLMAIPAQRMDPPDEPEVRFMETAASAPSAIKTWWYPGNTVGHEFIYPRKQAQQIAARSKQPVLTTAPGVIEGAGFPKESDKLARIDESGKDVPVEGAPANTAASGRTQTGRTSMETSTANARQPQRRAADAQDRDGDRQALPATSSSAPLVALLGFASLLAAAAIGGNQRFRM